MADSLKKYGWMVQAIREAPLTTKKDILLNFMVAKRQYLPSGATHADGDSLLKCALCPNMCRFDCPVLAAEKKETVSPAVKSRIAYMLLMNQMPSYDDAVEALYKCANCDACRHWCPFDFSVCDLLIGVRADMDNAGVIPSHIMRYRERVKKERTIFENGIRGLNLPAKKGDVLYFSGCTTMNRTPEIARANVKILEKAHVNYAALKKQWCCGAPLRMLGFADDFAEFARHNATQINDSGCKMLLCDCPECAYIFKDVYPAVGAEITAEIVHTGEYIKRLLADGALSLKEEKEVVTYHDPCVLARRMHASDEARAVLQAVPGVSLKETQFNREETKCCGLGGMLGVTNPETAKTIGKTRLAELKKASRTIITACPTCKFALARQNGSKTVTVRDLSELVADHLKE